MKLIEAQAKLLSLTQMPSIVYTVSLARTRRYQTLLGTISIHHLDPDFFCDYVMIGDTDSHIKMATPEKALLDILYLMPARSHLFKALPELDLTKKFDVKKAFMIVHKIKSVRRRAMVMKKLEAILK